MAASPALVADLDALFALFNRRSMDLPDGLLDRRSQFLLNGAPFESMLGRAATDPLVMMIARGPAGYRFAIKALQHAVPDARIERGGDVQDGSEPGTCAVSVRLSGRLRGSERPIETVLRLVLTLDGGTVSRADAALEPPLVPLLREARLLE